MKKLFFILLLTGSIGIIQAQTTKWALDKSHSSIVFAVDHMVISEVTGSFTKFDGAVLSDKNDFTDAKIEFVIDASSINTDNAGRDKHLNAPDFFDTAKFPTISFKSTSFAKITDKMYKLTGEFTMHGVTKTMAFDVTYGGTIQDPYGNTKAGFKLSGKLNRTDFGLTWSKTLETGALIVGEEVSLTARVELSKAK